jgi:hypothetical protein
MGGWIEVYIASARQWSGILNVGRFLTHSYEAYACLFGERNIFGFRPLVGPRGRPTELSRESIEESAVAMSGGDPLDFTWVSWAEIDAMDWAEQSSLLDPVIHEYHVQADGKLDVMRRVPADALPVDLPGLRETADRLAAQGGAGIQPREWRSGSTVFRAEWLTRRQCFTEDWTLAFEVMRHLAGRYGPEAVRMLVWFYG